MSDFCCVNCEKGIICSCKKCAKRRCQHCFVFCWGSQIKQGIVDKKGSVLINQEIIEKNEIEDKFKTAVIDTLDRYKNEEFNGEQAMYVLNILYASRTYGNFMGGLKETERDFLLNVDRAKDKLGELSVTKMFQELIDEHEDKTS